MRFIDEYRNKDLIQKFADRIHKTAVKEYTFMEVCGGHTAAIHRFGIPSLLPESIRLISGPGCPVCVTAIDYIDKAAAYSQQKDIIIATFGDLMKVPGSETSLENKRAEGADIRVVFSALDALEIAMANKGKKVIFLAIGFETTAPGTAITLQQAERKGINNFFILCAHKVMPPAMEVIVKEGTNLDGFICPGHVATITGSAIFNFLPGKYHLGCVVTGFEPTDILQALLMLINQSNKSDPRVEIQYGRAVTEKGNLLAKRAMEEVFVPSDSVWRGFGKIEAGGLTPGRGCERFDADQIMPVSVNVQREDVLCICPDILRGLKEPVQCPWFAGRCTPVNPMGACMVSSEGACNTWYKYKRITK